MSTDGRPLQAAHRTARTDWRSRLCNTVGFVSQLVNSGAPAIRLSVRTQSIDLTPLAAFGWLGLDVFFVLPDFC